MNAQFGDSLANGLTLSEIAMLNRADAVSDAGTPYLVIQGREPSVKFISVMKGVHANQRIKPDTSTQSRRDRRAVEERPNVEGTGLRGFIARRPCGLPGYAAISMYST
ncbi:MAG: hypothetical protein ABTS22_12105 [Accumulibacter sp.]|jgi:hypothetical protein|uniref:hypothetical protein n=1 Tax=Accumulibacter sp. TaxID=2053492 RepID=UPI0033161EE6